MSQGIFLRQSNSQTARYNGANIYSLTFWFIYFLKNKVEEWYKIVKRVLDSKKCYISYKIWSVI